MLGIRHKCLNLCLSLIARPSRIYRDVSVLIVKYTEIALMVKYTEIVLMVQYTETVL